MVMNVLYGYFDVKKNKLKWTGLLEDLKAFVLTLIDEETAEATTWHSPSGGKWIFESKPLVVTWQMKSENIYFEGEKSVALEEQIKTYMERNKLASGNDEPISECKQLLSDDSELNEAVLNLSNVCDDGPSESDKNSASNSKNYIAKNSVIDQDKRGEDSLQEECPKHTNSPDANSPDANSPDANFPSNVIRKTRMNSCFIQDNQMLSLEALQSQIQALTKEVSGNTATLENMREQSNPLLLQESKNEADESQMKAK